MRVLMPAALAALMALPVFAQQQDQQPSQAIPATASVTDEPKAVPASAPIQQPLAVTPTAAKPGSPAAVLDSTAHRHLGFFIRPDLGFGYLSATEPTNTTLGDVTISGLAGVAGVAIGGAIAENWILAGHLYDAVITSPSVTSSSGQSANASNAQFTMFGIGPEITYYGESNLYFSATIAVTRMTVTNGGRDYQSDAGIGSRLTLGKEWWVSDHWGLGLSGHLSLSTNNDPPASGTGAGFQMNTWGLGLAFSATYN